VSFASPYAAKAAYNLKVPHIALDDTEHATFARKFYLKYTTKVVTPDSFNVQLGPKQMWFKGFMELCYLHPDVFQPNPHVLNWLHLKPNEKFILLRFVSFQASHDIGQHGMSFGFKTELIQLLEDKGYKVFISSEQEIPDELKKYKLTIPPEEMHHLLYFTDGFIGEGATMASECAMLGTPAIYINSLNAGTLDTQEKMGLIRGFRNEKDVKQTVEDWLLTSDRKAVCRSINAAFVKSFPAPTDTIYEILCKFTK